MIAGIDGMDPREEVEEAVLEQRRGGTEAIVRCAWHAHPGLYGRPARFNGRLRRIEAPPAVRNPSRHGPPKCGEVSRECGFCGERRAPAKAAVCGAATCAAVARGAIVGAATPHDRSTESDLSNDHSRPPPTRPRAAPRRSRAAPTCYFGIRMLCALELGEPCTTFRPDSPHGLIPPAQPMLLIGAEEAVLGPEPFEPAPLAA